MLFIIWLLMGFLAAAIAHIKGRYGFGWFLIGLLVGPFALAVALMPPKAKDQAGM